MNSHDAQVIDDAIVDVEDIIHDARAIKDDATRTRIVAHLEGVVDIMHGSIRRLAPRSETPLQVDTPMGLEDDNLVPGVDY